MSFEIPTLTPNGATLAAAILSAVISAVVSGLIARYMIRHSANYGEQIKSIHETLASLARTQEELRRQQATATADEKEREEAEEMRAEAARWKPTVTLSSRVDGNQQVNKLIIQSPQSFWLQEVSLISSTGAKIFDYPMNKPITSSVGFGIPISQESLNLIANSSQSFFKHGAFEGRLRYKVQREGNAAAEYTGELPFHAQQVSVGNACFYQLKG